MFNNEAPKGVLKSLQVIRFFYLVDYRLIPIMKFGNMHGDWFILLLLLPTPAIWFSLDHKQNVSDGLVSGVGRNGTFLYSSDSNSVALMTPLTTPILIFTRS